MLFSQIATLSTYSLPAKRSPWPGSLSVTAQDGFGFIFINQKLAPLVFKVPFCDVEDHALVYGDLTARGTAGGLAGEYAGRGLLEDSVSKAGSVQFNPVCSPIAILGCRGRVLGRYYDGAASEECNWTQHDSLMLTDDIFSAEMSGFASF